MGFNFGAFTGGALKGAGDLMEKQHKETKDSIDSGMKFAYEQGLPFHRERMKDEKRFRGYASTLQNMQLGADQISVVMGKSEDFIKDFIVKSTAEKEAKPEFSIPSQVIVKKGGRITDWRNVHLGVMDLPNLKKPTMSNRDSLFTSMSGTSGSNNNTGFNNLVDRTRSEMESITGTSYNDVAAAGQQAYTYEQGSEGTVNIVNTAAQLDIEVRQAQLDQITQMNPLILDTARWNATHRVTVEARAVAQEEFEVTKRKWEIEAGEYKFAQGLDRKQTDEKIAQIETNIKIRKYGTSPESGLYALHLAIAEEQEVDNPDLEKIAALQKSKINIGIFLGELRADQNQANSDISYAQWNSSYESRINEILSLTVDAKNPAWYINERGVRSFDFNLNQSKEAGKQAKAQATSEFISAIRELKASNRPISGDLQQWIIVQPSFDMDLVTLDVMPENEADIVDDKLYAFNGIRLPSGASRNEDDPLTYSYSPPEGYNAKTDGLLRKHKLPTHNTWLKLTGAKYKAILAKKKSDRTRTSTVSDSPYAEPRLKALAPAENKLYIEQNDDSNRQFAQLASGVGDPDNAAWFNMSTSLEDDEAFQHYVTPVLNFFSRMKGRVMDLNTARAEVDLKVKLNVDKDPDQNAMKTYRTMYHSLRRQDVDKIMAQGQGVMTIEKWRSSLNSLMENTVTKSHMTWAIQELAKLPAQ